MTPKNFDIYIAISCTWLPSWISYLAIAKTENFEYSRLLKSRDKLPSFIEEAEAEWSKYLASYNIKENK